MAHTSTPDTSTTAEKPSVRLAPSSYIENFIQEELNGLLDEETDLLAFTHDRGRTYLMGGECIVDVTGVELALAPRTFASTSRKSVTASVWWGTRRRFNGKKAMQLYHTWETQEPKAVLKNTGRLYDWTSMKSAAILEANITSDSGEKSYVLVQRRYLWLIVRDLDELEHCTVELLESNQVRIRVGSRMLGMVMPLVKTGRVLSTEADLADELDGDDAESEAR